MIGTVGTFLTGVACGGAIGVSLHALIVRKTTVAIADVKKWHAALADVATAEEAKAKSIAAIVRNNIRSKLSEVGGEIRSIHL